VLAVLLALVLEQLVAQEAIPYLAQLLQAAAVVEVVVQPHLE
jgi:hypothetical protein